MRNVVLFSGGLDSLATVLRLEMTDPGGHDLQHVQLVYVQAGGRYGEAEEEVAGSLAKQLGKPLRRIALEQLGMWEEGVSGYVPYRNLFLVMVAVAELATYDWVKEDKEVVVWMGGLKDDVVEDKTPAAFEAMSKVLTQIGRHQVTVASLWWEHTKAAMVRVMLEAQGERFLALARVSMSCYRGMNCGDCPSCFRKYVALKMNGVDCEGWFLRDPRRTSTAEQYWSKMQQPGRYEESRRLGTLSVLREVFR